MNIPVNDVILKTLCDQEDITYLGLFGSQARNEAKPTSDVDILVDFEEPKSLFQLARIKEKLERVFNKNVDLVLRNNIKEQLKPYIMHDLITLYGQI